MGGGINMSISIVIPYKSRTKNNTELIYALRSLEKNLNGFGDVFIVGEKISSLKGLNYIKVKDDTGSQFKERNIYRKILAACNDERVSDDFIFTNDDIILTKQFDVNNLPFYHKGELIDTMAKNSGDYRKSLNHSRKYLMKMANTTLDYDTHFPIVYNKKDFATFVCNDDLNWNQPYGYVIKSLYANQASVKGEYIEDCKIKEKLSYDELKQKISGRSFFSTSDGVINEGMIKLLNETYQQKSKYEK